LADGICQKRKRDVNPDSDTDVRESTPCPVGAL
jgi:hypothetical protein